MTAKVTSSASDSLGAIPTAGRQGARCGEVFSRSSVVTYSAVARVSRAASTGPPRLDVGFATPILDALLHLRIWLLGGRKLRPLGIGHLVHEGLQRACPFADNEKEKCVGLAEGGVVTDESLVERLRLEPLAGLRALRKALREEERQVSYWRRLVQGRLDLAQAALAGDQPSVEKLTATASGRRPDPRRIGAPRRSPSFVKFVSGIQDRRLAS